ncbi:MAG: VCBS repeat-containing protein, partial [Planctomycetaceae bacterium]
PVADDAFCRVLLVLSASLVISTAAGCDGNSTDTSTGRPRAAAQNSVDETTVRKLCSQCHKFTEPDILPQSEWRDRVSKMVTMPGYGNKVRQYVNPEAVVNWFIARAPKSLTLPVLDDTIDRGSLEFQVNKWIFPTRTDRDIVISNVQLADLVGEERDGRLELIACDMRNGLVFVGHPDKSDGPLTRVARVGHPARIQVVDLDQDGLRDLLVADLGSFTAIDHNLGTVTWLQQQSDRTFRPVVLADSLSRVADARAADFDGDGDLDLVVAEFGWRRTGRVLLLEHTGQAGPPVRSTYRLKTLDERHGAIHTPPIDLDGDGRLDFVALIAQEHEAVVAFMNKGSLTFEAHTLYQAPHPSWGSSGLQLVDLDQDGDVDALITNGDTMDDAQLKPGHGVRWLENTGGLNFQEHTLARLYGVHRAEACDIDDDGDLDVIAAGFVAEQKDGDRDTLLQRLKVPSILWIEQVHPGKFRPRALESHLCNHPTLTVGDADGDGDVDIFVGNNTKSRSSSPVEFWKNTRR